MPSAAPRTLKHVLAHCYWCPLLLVISMSRAIQAIPTASVAKICSGQVILDLSTAVKELVENALDAGATSVEVRLREHGLELIEVADNGKGVPQEDHAALALKYHTSKISQFSDLESLHTYGFRGEALSSLAAISSLAVITRTADQSAATRLEFDFDGRLTGSSAVARAVGTTVAVKDLFTSLPVRRQEFQRNVRREVAKLKLLLQQYAIMSTQAQLYASDQAGKGARTVLVSTGNAGSSMSERVAAVLGSKVAGVLVPLEVKLPDDGGTVTGLVSRAACGVKGDKLRQFFCINGRPVELPRAIKVLNDTYKSLYSSLVGLRPMAFLSLELPPASYDINVTPDKRSVFLQREVAIVNALGQALQALWEPSRHSYAVNQPQPAFDEARPLSAVAASTLPGRARADSTPTARQHEDPLAAAADAAAEAGEDAVGAEHDDAAAAAGGCSLHGTEVSAPSAAAAAGAAPVSLASFMREPVHAAAAGAASHAAGQLGDSSSSEQGSGLQQQAADSAAAVVPAADMCATTAAAAAAGGAQGKVLGTKRLRPLEAALLGRKVPKGHCAAAAAAAAADGSVDVDHGLQEHAPAETSWQQQQQQRRQGVPLPLSAFQLAGPSQALRQCSPGPAGAAAATATAADGDRAGTGSAGSSRRGGDHKQQSLAAFGFRVSLLPPQQQQQQALRSDEAPVLLAAGAAGGTVHSSQEQMQEVAAEAEASADGGAQQRQQLERHTAAPAAAAAAATASGHVGTEERDAVVAARCIEDSDDDVVLVDDGAGDDVQQQQQQQQQQKPPPQQLLVLDYGMQQLLTDAQLHLQRLKQQQQQQEAGESSHGTPAVGQHRLAAASLQGEAADTPGGTGADTTTANGAGAASGPDAATSELMRVFNKADFAAMSAVGQFNLGFIIAKLRGDLFIVDQHAADEKSTFERLLGTYSVNKQPLLQPRRLHTLTAMDQQAIRQHTEVFRRNGFEFVERQLPPSGPQRTQQQQQQPLQPGACSSSPQRVLTTPPHNTAAAAAEAALQQQQQGYGAAAEASAAADGPEAVGVADVDMDAAVQQGPGDGCGAAEEVAGAAGSELLLSAVPVLKGGATGGGGAMGEEVLLELLDLIGAGETRQEDIRPKKVRDMLASRACRTSIMIGSPLSRQQQARILSRLAQLEAPFNCPHGRPTMRHLAVLPGQQGSAGATGDAGSGGVSL